MKLIDQYERHRAEAFITVPRPLWVQFREGKRKPLTGPTVVPLTWARYHQLSAEGNPVLGAAFTRAHVVRALWILSPHYRTGRVAWSFYRVYQLLKYKSRTGRELRAFLLDAFLEAPKASAAAAEDYPATSQIGMLVAFFGSRCSYTPQQVLDMPVAMAYQIFNALTGARAAADGPAYNPVQDKLNGERIRRKTAEMRAKAAAAQAKEATV